MIAIAKSEIVYPESDRKPMADNTVQFRWITLITAVFEQIHHKDVHSMIAALVLLVADLIRICCKSNLDWLFAQDEQVFVAGDLLWYPVEGDNKKRQAPDVMVVFGRPKGDRGSYQQWKEDNIAVLAPVRYT